jgi:hypothetical protein
MLVLLSPTTLLVVDSTPLIDLFDPEARWGKSSRGWLKGFKIHASVNQQGLPFRAKVTPANYYDSPIIPDISWDLKATYLLADAGYNSKINCQVAKSIGAVAVIAEKPRKRGKNNPKNKAPSMYSLLLRAKHYLVVPYFLTVFLTLFYY